MKTLFDTVKKPVSSSEDSSSDSSSSGSDSETESEPSKIKTKQSEFHNGHKFSDRQVQANSVDPDQTAPEGKTKPKVMMDELNSLSQLGKK